MPNEGEEYTPEEWVQLFLEATPEKRLEVTRIVLEGHRKGTRCFLEGHENALFFARHHHCPPDRYGEGWQDALRHVQREMEKTDGNV